MTHTFIMFKGGLCEVQQLTSASDECNTVKVKLLSCGWIMRVPASAVVEMEG